MSPKRFIFTITWVKSNLEELLLDLLFLSCGVLEHSFTQFIFIFYIYLSYWFLNYSSRAQKLAKCSQWHRKSHLGSEMEWYGPLFFSISTPILMFVKPSLGSCKDVMQGKLFQKCKHLLYCSILSLGGNVIKRRMSKLDMGSIFHIKNQWNILVIRNYYVNYQNYQN